MTGLRKQLQWLLNRRHKMRNTPSPSKESGTVNYQDFQESAIKDQVLRRQMAAKALDLPFDTMGDITVHNGTDLKGILAGAIVATALLGGGGGAAYFLSQLYTPKAEKVVETVIEKQTDVWDYKIEMEVDRK